MPARKTLDDFPKFTVESIRKGETLPDGYTTFEIDGKFDRAISQLGPTWFWLLLGNNQCLCPALTSLDPKTGTATVICHLTREPNLLGKTLAYLRPYWNADNIWMVLDPDWGWRREEFRGRDATAQDYEAKETSIVDGREVRIWTKVEAVDEPGGRSRHYPAADQTSPPNPTPRIVPGGWGHQHCSLCLNHIDSGNFGYRDPDDRWVCENCYNKYVVPHDLAFVDEL
jgi:hypothetical protein